MTWEEIDGIEYNTINAFKTSDSNMPGYYIVQWTGNAYNLQKIYTFHALDPPVLVPEGGLVCTAKFVTPMRKKYYRYHEPNEAILIIVKLK